MTKKRPAKEHSQPRSKTQRKPNAAKRTATALAAEGLVTIDRRAKKASSAKQEPVAAAPRPMERRAKVSRRRQIDPTTCERDYTPEEVEFMSALEQYKRRSGRMFPTCSEVLEVLKDLGYAKQSETPLSPLPLTEAFSVQSFAPLTDSAV